MNIIQTLKTKAAPVALGFVLAASGMAYAPQAHAATTAELQAQIAVLLVEIQQLQAQLAGTTGTPTAGNCVFTRNLTIGVSGADVTCLQTYLIGHGFAIPAGATGYFGTQTQGATAAWQAANGVAPPAGYFGPISRAKYSALAAVTPTQPSNPSAPSITLHGGEADLTNFDLIAEDGSMSEGDTDVKLATAEFDVNDGDVKVQRADLEFQATDTGKDVKPWKYFDSISIWDGSKRLATVDAGDQDNWDDHGDDGSHGASSAKYYTITLSGFNDVVREGDTAELTFTADMQPTIDSDNEGQEFRVTVPDTGLRAVDALGIQQYTGDVTDYVRIDVNAAENGDLSVRKNSDNPAAGTLVADDTNTSSEYTVLAFDVKNSADVDTRLTDMIFEVATGSASGSPASDITDIVRRARLTIDGRTYNGDINSDNTIDFTDMNAVVDSDDTITGTLKISLYGQTGHYAAAGETLTFSLDSDNLSAEGDRSGDNVSNSHKSGSANGNEQTIAVNGGITPEGRSMNANLTYNSNDPDNSYGTFTLKFDVTAVGDDVYIPATAAVNTGSTTYAGVVYDPNMLNSTSGATMTAALTSTADTEGPYNMYVLHEGDTETFTLTVTVNPTSTGDFQVGVDKIKFSSSDDLSGLQTLEIDQSKSQYHTDPLHIPS